MLAYVIMDTEMYIRPPATSNRKLPAILVNRFQQLTDVRKSRISDVAAPYINTSGT